jgi:hypothetical protein
VSEQGLLVQKLLWDVLGSIDVVQLFLAPSSASGSENRQDLRAEAHGAVSLAQQQSVAPA